MRIILVTIFIILTAVNLNAASFNCSKARTPLEKAICSNPQISKADGEMGRLYFKVLRKLNLQEKNKFKASHRKWLKERLSTCAANDSKCLLSVYSQRIDLYRSMGKTEIKPGLNGCYSIPRTIEVYNGKDWEETKASDTFSIKNFNGNSFFFSLETVATNAHMCSLEGTAKRKGDHFIWVADKSDDEDCALRIYIKEDRIIVDGTRGKDGESEGPYCRNFCGMRAYLDTYEFLLTSRKTCD